MIAHRQPHARDTETHIWMREDRHWTPRAEHEAMLAMSDRELRHDYRKWSLADHNDTKRESQSEL